MGIRAANQAMLATGGEFQVSRGGQQYGIGETGAFDKEKLEKGTEPVKLDALVKSQMSLAEKQFANTDAIAENIAGQLAVSENLLKVMNISQKVQDAAGATVRGSVDDKGVQQLQEKLFKSMKNALSSGDEKKAREIFSQQSAEALAGAFNPKRGKTAAEPFYEDIKNTATKDFPELIKSIQELIDAIKNDKKIESKDLIKSKSGTFSLLPEDGIIAGTGVDKLISFVKDGGKNLVEKTKEMAKTTGDIAQKVGKTVGEKAEEFKKVGKEQEKMYTPPKNKSSFFSGKPNLPTETELSGQDFTKKTNESKSTQESGKVGGEITLNLNFTADSNSAGFASQIVEVFKTNTELQQTITREIAKVSSGQGLYNTESFDGKGNGKSKVTAV
jgi:hypothetical protein